MKPITEPGVYEIPADEYHADPTAGGSLSVSGAKLLIPPSTPAAYAYWRGKRRAERRVFDVGQAAHKLVLGDGPDIVEVVAEDWRTTKAKTARDEAYTAGKVPLLTGDFLTVHAMALALRKHPIASTLFEPGYGTPEASLFWKHWDTDVWMRGRLDWLPSPYSGRLIVPDYKTSHSANPDVFARSAMKYRYHMQAPWYLDGLEVLGLDGGDAVFVFVVQETSPPFLVSTVQLDAEAMRIGRRLNQEAVDLYAQCVADNNWPGYGDEVATVSYPHWYTRDYEEWS